MKNFLLLSFVLMMSNLTFSQTENHQGRKASKNQSKIKQDESTVKQVDVQKTTFEIYNVSILVTHYYPYCGGAYPDEDQLNNYSVLSNTTFILHNFKTNKDEFVKSDSTGTIKLDLSDGKYGIKELYKNCSFEEFYKNHHQTNQQYVEQGDSTCYKNWWMSYLTEFEISDSTPKFQSNVSIYDACFTGTNPCLYYFGPYPP